MKKFILLSITLATSAFITTACNNDADIASKNLSTAADNFEINRRVIFYNGITNEYLLEITGLCSLKADGVDRQVEVTCKTGPKTYKKHFLGLSDNVTYFSEQLEPSSVSAYHYRVTFKPQTILPDIDLKGSVTDIPKSQ